LRNRHLLRAGLFAFGLVMPMVGATMTMGISAVIGL
jgi:hypothetical protein